MRASIGLPLVFLALAGAACRGFILPGDTTNPGGGDGGDNDAGTVLTGTPCNTGAIGPACDCGGAAHTQGFCCDDLWFDAHYETLTGGCPAGTYRYVDPAHPAASDTNPGTADLPWATLGRATWGSTSRDAPSPQDAAQAGDVVLVRSGVHRGPGTVGRNDSTYNPVNSGTAGAPIVFKAVGNVEVRPLPSETGTVRTATATTVQLATDASSVNDAYAGWRIRIVSGTGAGQHRPIMQVQTGSNGVISGSYAGATRTATIQHAWAVIPDTTSVYQLTRTGPTLGTFERSHIVWDGFRVFEDDGYFPDTGPVVVWGSQNVAMLHLEVNGTALSAHYDNHNAIRVEDTTGYVVASCVLQNLRASPDDAVYFNNPQNQSGMTLYGTHDGVIENNEIRQIYGGLFPKGDDNSQLALRFNHIHDTAYGFRTSFSTDLDIHQNVIHDVEYAYRPAENIGSIRFFNNVVFRAQQGASNWFASSGYEVFNNAFLEVGFPHFYEAGMGTFLSDNNAFFSFTGFREGTVVHDLAAWQGRGHDQASTTTDPRFLDADALNFHLQAASPLAVGGRGGAYPTARGVYVTGNEVIGPRR